MVTGNAGESEVTAQFERLGWGVVPNARHDVGTDLWLMARDGRLFDLGLVVGAQVKSGPSWFDEPFADASGTVTGWWFRSDAEHVDAWLAHRNPHLVVLRDSDAGVSYWAEVTPGTVESTGKGSKIFVPAANRVDEANHEALLRAAASQRPGAALEGSAWTGATAVRPAALLRHALLVPRLIAPHPNTRRSGALTAVQGVALLVQARLSDLDTRAEDGAAVPSWDEALGRDDWDWRLFGALGRRVTGGDVQALVDAARSAPDAARRAAASVAAAATLLEDGLADDALAVLDDALGRDDAEPIDQAWLEVQRGRALAEVGRTADARAMAAGVQSVAVTHADDVTATALAGAAAQLLFNTSSWAEADVAGLVASSDTAAAWWRTQTLSRALDALTERTFRKWSADPAVRMTNGDPVNDQLVSASLTAGYAGDHGAWRHTTALLGVDGFLRLPGPAATAAAADALRTLVLAGDSDGVKHAVRRLSEDGPVLAVRAVAGQWDLDRLTRTTAPAVLTLLERGGDLLDPSDADRAVRWLRATLADPSVFYGRTTPRYLVEHRLVGTLAGVVAAATGPVQAAVAQAVAALPPQVDPLVARAWASVARALPYAAWTAETAGQAGSAAGFHEQALESALRTVHVAHDESARGPLLAAAAAGDLSALAALGDVRDLPAKVVGPLVRSLTDATRQVVTFAEAGTYGIGQTDAPHALTLLNLHHPDVADWSAVVELVASGAAVSMSKAGTLRALAGMADLVPPQVRAPLADAARVVAMAPPKEFSGLLGEDADLSHLATELVAALSEDVDPGVLPLLLSGDAAARAAAARVARRLGGPEHVGMLVALTVDIDPTARATAAHALAAIVAAGAAGDATGTATAAVRLAAKGPGRRTALAVASALAAQDAPPGGVEDILVLLRSNPSARVRAAAAKAAP